MLRVLMVSFALLLSSALAWGQGAKSSNVIDSVVNDTTTGTTNNLLAKIVSGTAGKGKAIRIGTGDTGTPGIGLVIKGGGTTGEATILFAGEGPCIMNNAGTGVSGRFVVPSGTSAGRCEQQASPPTNGIVIGIMRDDTTSVGVAAQIIVNSLSYVPGASGAGTGTVNTGNANAIACYAGTGTTVDDCVQPGTNNFYPKWSGGALTNSTGPAAGVGVCTNQLVRSTVADAAPTCATVTSTDVNNSIAVTGSGINTNSQPVSAPLTWAFQGKSTPGALSGTLFDYTGCTAGGQGIACLLNPGNNTIDMTGIQAPGTDGTVFNVCNVTTGTGTLVLRNNFTGTGQSTAANRFLFGTSAAGVGVDDITLFADQCHFIRYDVGAGAAPAGRWRSISQTVPDWMRIRSIMVSIGDPGTASPALAGDNDDPYSFGNDTGRDMVVLGVACIASVPSVNILPTLGPAGNNGNILTGPCACGDMNQGINAVFNNCPLSGTPTIKPFNVVAGSLPLCPTQPCTVNTNIDGTPPAGAKIIKVKYKVMVK